MSKIVIRNAVEADLVPLTELYNYYIRETAITFDIEPFTVEARRPWIRQFDAEGPHRLFVAEVDGLASVFQFPNPDVSE